MAELKDITVLYSASNSPTSPGISMWNRKITERKVRSVGMDMTSDPSAKYMTDVFYRVPPATDKDYIDIVLDICRKEKVDIFIPGISAELPKIAERMDEFKELGVIVSISNQESIKIANNKLHTYQELEKVGIPVPKYYPVSSVEDFIEGCRHMGYPEKPVCLKIVEESGSRGVRIIDANKSRYEIYAHQKPNSFYTSYDDMLSILKSASHLDQMMLLEVMHGPEYTVDLLADKGKVLYIGGRENVESLMSIAQESVVKYDAHAYDVATRIVAHLKMDGNVGFDFMRNEAGEAVLMDINPRTTATLSVFAAAGMNLPYLRLKQLLGEELPEINLAYGTRVKRRYHETFTDANGNLLI